MVLALAGYSTINSERAMGDLLLTEELRYVLEHTASRRPVKGHCDGKDRWTRQDQTCYDGRGQR